MVFVWSSPREGEPTYTLSQVALNDVIMVFLFAPLVGLLLGLTSVTVPWGTLMASVLLYIVVPVVAAQLGPRVMLANKGGKLLSIGYLVAWALCRSVRCWQPSFCCSASRGKRSWRSR